MRLTLSGTSCCAIDDIHYLRDYQDEPEKALKHFCEQYFDRVSCDEDEAEPLCAHILFSEVTAAEDDYEGEGTYGKQFAGIIKKYKLGKVVATSSALNPNHSEKGSRHWVKAYIWTPNRTALKKWAKENGIIKEAPDNAYSEFDFLFS